MIVEMYVVSLAGAIAMIQVGTRDVTEPVDWMNDFFLQNRDPPAGWPGAPGAPAEPPGYAWNRTLSEPLL